MGAKPGAIQVSGSRRKLEPMDANLKVRILAAVALIPLAVGAVLLLPGYLFAIFAAVFVIAAAWEWSALAGLTGTAPRGLFVALVAAALLGFWYYPQGGMSLLWCAAGYWVICTACIISAQRQAALRWLDSSSVRLLAGWVTLVPAWWGLVWLHTQNASGPALVLLIFVIVWGADIGAYFSGRQFGRRKLASRVSPGKTIEGAGGALVCVAIAAAVFWAVQPLPWLNAVAFFGLCLLAGVVSVIGDLAESLFKRRAGIKDSGGLIPGHGGVLDRVDSITAAAPIFALGLAMLGGAGAK
jgi:phosphatidate cytidylyltransferase